ncbi:hypothetical protein NM688_g2081 [Phlebia brevispora]|uniref:Uncharacterized protein n=1 Tax=Phlebia brevispora TaxID=194682 RepID=A0ACC1T9Z5_9APHY|nr:hypothetical protein NM688_g2081 [Phlebia brevispora]
MIIEYLNISGRTAVSWIESLHRYRLRRRSALVDSMYDNHMFVLARIVLLDMATNSAQGGLVTIAVVGATGTGKSTFVNLLSSSNFLVGTGLRSCTPAVQVSPEFSLNGRRFQLIDTPGFDDTLKTDREILRLVSNFLADQYRKNTKLHGIIFMQRISDVKMSGISRRNFGMIRSLCGDNTLKNVIIVTNMWGEITDLPLTEARA